MIDVVLLIWITGERIQSFCPAISSILFRYRLLFSGRWILYDALVGSVSGIVCEAFSIGSILVSLFRYGLATLDG